jgi:hypothetical protein
MNNRGTMDMNEDKLNLWLNMMNGGNNNNNNNKGKKEAET